MRTVDYSVSDIGPVVYLDGNDNYKVLDNDLLGTSTLIGTGSNQPGASFLGGGSATNGLIARNTLWNANAAHWFDDIKQVIFEWNTVRPGGVGTRPPPLPLRAACLTRACGERQR